MKSTSKNRTPTIVNLTVKRRYLTEREIERLMDCARKYGRCGPRDPHAHPRHPGGDGQDEARQFYATWFIDRWPADVQITPISRTAGQGRVIDEFHSQLHPRRRDTGATA